MFNLIKKSKKRIEHWTPHYIFNRINLFFTEKMNPDWPWLTKDAVKILNQLLKKDDVGLEFGSGRSTVWLAKKVKKIISIEDDKNWFKKIQKDLNDKNLNNVDYKFKSPKEYTFDGIEDESIDFVLVDGQFRDLCVEKSISKIKKGGLIIIDNINRYVPNISHSPGSIRDTFASDIWQDIFLNKIKNWRCVWTTNGVTDTLILFKS